ncbi:MAG: hypothetical protein HY667_01050 [Chloroflexi bacterium]|nr:hypothetical protein [Chloroflexota bacterium]
MLSPGRIANAAIGRAMGLIIKNIGGARPGIEDMGVNGNPMKYSGVIAENEEESPWPPLHVERGFHKDDSTVTVFFPNSYYQMTPYRTDEKGIISTMLYNLGPGRRDGHTCILLRPPLARTLASNGWTKQEIAAYIAKHAYVPFAHHPHYWASSVTEDAGGDARRRLPLTPQDPILLIPFPERIKLVVAGGPGIHMAIIRGSHFASEGTATDFVTKRVELPRNWDKLVQKYKGVLPAYASY